MKGTTYFFPLNMDMTPPPPPYNTGLHNYGIYFLPEAVPISCYIINSILLQYFYLSTAVKRCIMGDNVSYLLAILSAHALIHNYDT